MSDRKEHPVLYGLVALVGVGVAVGLIAGVAAFFGAHVVGNADSAAARGSQSGASLYLPKPKKTDGPSGPTVTLHSTSSSSSPSGTAQAPAKPRKQITLTSGETQVSPMGHIDLTGSYPGGEGAVLQVQKLSNGSWQDFYSISATVTNSTFSTYIQTGTPGLNRFRVRDTDTGTTSNEVRVTVG
ncbi:MAG: hypothetical protein ACR2K3_01080 [Nocardioides sp.]